MSALSLIDGILHTLAINQQSLDSQSMTSIVSKSPFKLYTSWFCPFAQRVQLALELKRIPYEYIDVDPYNKSKEWLAKNPRGLVPTICHHDEYIYESLVILEYLEDAFPNTEHKLFPMDPVERAMNRIWIDHIQKRIIKPFYQMLQFQDNRKEERTQAVTEYFSQISTLMHAMHCDGPYFNGNQLGAVDLVFLPWATRMFLLEHYRGIKYKQCFEDKDALQRYEQWYGACAALDIVKATQKSLTISYEKYPEELIKKYKRYADNTAASEVAVAINNNTTLP